MKIFIVIVFLIASALLRLQAQNDILLNHYMFNEIVYNPAVAGFSPKTETTFLHRQQWVGFEEAPNTQNFNIHSFVRKIGGVGMSITNDRLGNEASLNAKLIYAHYVQLSSRSFLSFGVGLGVLSKSIHTQNLIFEDPDDVSTLLASDNRIKPDFDFGIEYNSSHLTIGLSTTHIEQSLSKVNNFQIPRHYYAYLKYRIEASDKLNIVPGILMKSSVFITQFDISSVFYYDNKFFIGASYRPNDMYVALLGFHVNKNLKFSYAFDHTIKKVSLSNAGSHELMLSYGITKNSRREHMKSPRYFN